MLIARQTCAAAEAAGTRDVQEVAGQVISTLQDKLFELEQALNILLHLSISGLPDFHTEVREDKARV